MLFEKYPLSEQRPAKEGENLGQISPPADHANHRKTNSYPQAPPQRRPADPRIPDGGPGRTAAVRHQGEPWEPLGLHEDPRGVSAWPEGVRVDGSALGPDRLRHGHAAR